MKKISISIFSVLFALVVSSTNLTAGSIGLGVSGAFMNVEADGKETEATVSGVTSETTKKSVDNNAFIGSIFGEYSFANVSYANSGVTFGIRYTPGSADVSDKVHSRTDSAVATSAGGAENDTGTYKAQAQVENYINYYLDIPLFSSVYVKAGWAQIDVITQESATSTTIGSYGDATLDGINYGLGVKGENGNVIWKLAYEVTNFDTLNLTSSTSNKIKADLDTSEVNISVGYKF